MKSVLITGAYGGMGYATVRALAKEGFTVFALDQKVGLPEENVVPVQADVTDPQSVRNAFDTVKAATDEIYAVIHFAGVYMLDSLVEIPDDGFERIFRINLFGAFYINKTFLPLLKRGGRIPATTAIPLTILL